mgnify:CR=1 FL=1
MRSERTPDGYDSLREVLNNAFNQASIGKGKERHATDEPFTQQPILTIARLLDNHPAASLLFQAMKKITESGRLPTDRGIAELYGAIVYISAAILFLEEKHGQKAPRRGV